MDLVLDEAPALVVTLHESKKRYDPAVVPSFGQTIVYGVDPRPDLLAEEETSSLALHGNCAERFTTCRAAATCADDSRRQASIL